MFRQGDIVAFRGKVYQQALNSLIAPYSDRWHFAIITEYVPEDQDYVIAEMLSDGCRTGRLFRDYKGHHAKVYRVPDAATGKRIAQATSRYGRTRYDYILFAWLFWTALRFWVRHGFQPVPYTWFTNFEDRPLICTELVQRCCRDAHYPLFPDHVAPTPAAFEQAWLDEDVALVYNETL